MNELQQKQLAAIRERRAKITDPPWEFVAGYPIQVDLSVGVRQRTSGGGGTVFRRDPQDASHVHEIASSTWTVENAAFIAHAPADIDLLLSLLADAERERDEATARAFRALELSVKSSDQAATATERAERAADAERAEIVAWLRKQKESEAIVEAAVVAGSYADAIEAGDFQAKGGGDGQ